MKVVSIVASKGGVGKTTVSNVLAGLLAGNSFHVELWDADCNQYSSETMGFSNLLDYEVVTVPDITTLEKLLKSSKNDYVVIDTAPHSHDSELFIQILNSSDLVVGITRPLPNDVFAFEKIMMPVLSKIDTKKALLINQKNHIQSSIQQESINLIKNRINPEIGVLETALHSRASYAAIGYFETDSKIDKKRIDESKSLYEELTNKGLL